MPSYFLIILFAICYSYELFEDYYKEAEKYLKNMTMTEKIGQMFFPRFNLTNSSYDIKNKKPDGFVLFANDFNFDEKFIQQYITSIQELSNKTIGIPFGLAVDEEGGKVNRVSKKHRKSGPFPSPQQIYNESDIEEILNIDQEKRDLLRKFFINVNLAPGADISWITKILFIAGL